MLTKRHFNLFLITALISALALSTATPRPAHAAAILRATETGLTSGICGADWTANACSLQNALSQAVSGDEIWVAAGTYRPTATGDRTVTFQLKSGVALYGGFAGTETLRSERDWATNVTILSGDIGTLGTVTDNSYNVVTGSGMDATAVLDGFTITGGNDVRQRTYDHQDYGQGRGMANSNGSPTITNATFSGNTASFAGGGMANSNGRPTLTNVIFSGNSASSMGGGIFNNSSSPTLTNITFSGNSAGQGGGIFNNYSSPTLINITFNGNSAGYGGGIYNYESTWMLTNATFSGNRADQGGGLMNTFRSATLTNVTFSGNSARYGGGIYNQYSSLMLANSTLWGNTASLGGAQIYGGASVTYSDVQGGWSGTGNLDADPLFVDADGADNVPGTGDDNLRLRGGSPAINAGSNAAVPAGMTTDLDGAPRIFSGVVDMGAYEYQHHRWHVNDDGAAGTGCISWSDACPDLQTAWGRPSAAMRFGWRWERTGPRPPVTARLRSSSRPVWRSTAASPGPRRCATSGIGRPM